MKFIFRSVVECHFHRDLALIQVSRKKLDRDIVTSFAFYVHEMVLVAGNVWSTGKCFAKRFQVR